MATLHKQLEQLGFNPKEAKTYLALLELGEGTLADLARKSRIKRTTLYDIVRSLKDKGLISAVRSGGRLLYSAEDPRTLDDRLREQQTVLSTALPELLSITNALPQKPKIRYYEGIEGIKEVYRDTLEYPDQELLAWVSEEAGVAFDIDFLNQVYLPGRIRKKIWVRAIVPNIPLMREFLGEDLGTLRTTRGMDHARFPLDVEINLYGRRRVALMSFREQSGLIIENESIYTTFKSIFEQQWASLE
jgi:HTH-type transcriptional regulator, sugar sensing transcriptional regulator